MGKQSKINKKLKQKQEIQGKSIQKPQKTSPKKNENSSDSEERFYVPEEDFWATLETIQKLGKRLDIFKSTKYKAIRAALHPLFEEKIKKEGQAAVASTKNLANCIGSALFDGRFDDAISYLEDYKKKNCYLKLGTVMRWVRDLNLNTVEPERQKVRVMYAILKCYPEFQGKDNFVNNKETFALQNPEFEVEEESKGDLIRIDNWASKELLGDKMPKEGENPYKPEDFSVILHEKAEDRKPPNQYDLDICVTKEPLNYYSYSISEENRPKIERFDVPWVPGAYVINNVLAPQDCQQIVQMSETMGFKLDVPIGSESDFRAHGCVWFADEKTNDFIFDRCKAMLPVLNGNSALGLNRRWRLYKYNPGNVYRPHIDGAWPGSGEKNGQYQFDGFGDRYSKLTMVIYLTEGFEGGQTTFYTPSMEHKGCIESRGVSPRIGSLLLFPHGEQAGALIHEGSAVFDKGRKYIIRTEVLYKLN